jgi:hypothetical protein
VAYFAFQANTDDRSKKGIVPLVLRNLFLEPQAEGAGKNTNYVLAPTPGMTSRVTPASGSNIRGVFCRAGVQSGALFVVAGTTLYEISSAWSAINRGEVLGAGRVLFAAVGANLVLLSSGVLYQWDGSSLTKNTDPDFPADAYTLADLADRILTSQRGSDTFDWSAVGSSLDWPATGFAASARYPDEIRAQAEIGGDLFHFGAASIQPWRAQGGQDSDAFDVIPAIVINRGIVGRDAWARLDSYAMFIGDDRVVYEISGYLPQRVVNRDLELRLAALSESEIAEVQCFSHTWGSHLKFVVKLPTGSAFVFDALTRKWHERTALGETGFGIVHYARFNGYHVVASDDDDAIYTWDEGVYSDAGASIDRVAMLHIPVPEKMTISNVTLDIKTFGQPVSGDGSDPKAYVTFYRDGGSLDSLQQLGIERVVSLGRAGNYRTRPTIWRLGIATPANGLIVKVRLPDPAGYAIAGAWVNEIPN